jgi:hypothetical protein
MENKTAVAVSVCGIAVDDTGLRPILATHRNGFASKINIAITIATISAGLNYHDILIISVVDRCLDVIEIRWGIVIDGDCACCTRNCQKQTD